MFRYASIPSCSLPCCVLLADDHQMVRLGVRASLENGMDAVSEIRRVSPSTIAVLLTMHTDRSYVLQALQAGAEGYVLKTQAADDLIRAIL